MPLKNVTPEPEPEPQPEPEPEPEPELKTVTSNDVGEQTDGSPQAGR